MHVAPPEQVESVGNGGAVKPPVKLPSLNERGGVVVVVVGGGVGGNVGPIEQAPRTSQIHNFGGA